MTDTSGVAKASNEAELTEDDIPGAALADPLQSHTVPALKWWLLFRGIKVPSSWKKEQLVRRWLIVVFKKNLLVCVC